MEYSQLLKMMPSLPDRSCLSVSSRDSQLLSMVVLIEIIASIVKICRFETPKIIWFIIYNDYN